MITTPTTPKFADAITNPPWTYVTDTQIAEILAPDPPFDLLLRAAKDIGKLSPCGQASAIFVFLQALQDEKVPVEVVVPCVLSEVIAEQ